MHIDTQPILQKGLRLFFVGFVLALASVPVLAQPSTFSTEVLDLGFIGTADAVVRLEQVRFEVEDPGHARKTVRRVVTILGPEGRGAGILQVEYDDRLRHLKDLDGRLLDARGERIRSLKKDDLDDRSNISAYSLYEENRTRTATLLHDAYPYTVDYEYVVDYDGLLSWPTWYPQEDNIPVEYTSFEIIAPLHMTVRYDVQGMALPPDVRTQRDEQRLFWELRRLPAHVPEPLGPSWSAQRVAVHTAPTVFAMEGTQGDMRSWASFGQWYARLSTGRGAETLPGTARAEVHRLTGGLLDDREKIRRLYEYLQAKTRYVSVQLGLGGWQPYDAAYVHARSYGDCKALTNYLRALLEMAGIPSYPALIRSGRNAPEVLAHFPSNQFNHVILYVPLDDGPLWLESTSQTMPFGHIGAANEDRYALVTRLEGSELIRTPRSSARDNQRIRRATVHLETNGDAFAEVRTRYTGNQQDGVRRSLATATGRERETWLHASIDAPSFAVRSADFSGVTARQPEVAVRMDLDLPSYASRTGRRLFLRPRLLDGWAYVPPPAAERTQPVVLFPYPLAQADTIRYILPDGYAVEALPDSVMISEPFGSYRATVAVSEGKLVYHRRFEITEPRLPAAQYAAVRSFLSAVARADRNKAVLVRQ